MSFFGQIRINSLVATKNSRDDIVRNIHARPAVGKRFLLEAVCAHADWIFLEDRLLFEIRDFSILSNASHTIINRN